MRETQNGYCCFTPIEWCFVFKIIIIKYTYGGNDVKAAVEFAAAALADEAVGDSGPTGAGNPVTLI